MSYWMGEIDSMVSVISEGRVARWANRGGGIHTAYDVGVGLEVKELKAGGGFEAQGQLRLACRRVHVCLDSSALD